MKNHFMIAAVLGIITVSVFSDKINVITESQPVKNISNETCMPRKDIYHYDTDTFEQFKSWLMNPYSHTMNNGAFQQLIDMYEECNYILSPSISGKIINNVFVDSNVNMINYVFIDPAIRVCIEPINSIADKQYNASDIQVFMENNYDIILNKLINIDTGSGENQVLSGYEYNSRYYTRKNVQMENETELCILESRQSEKSDTEHILSFIKDDMFIRIIYYDNDGEEFDMQNFKSLSFEKNTLYN